VNLHADSPETHPKQISDYQRLVVTTLLSYEFDTAYLCVPNTKVDGVEVFQP
jgi:hypothetical protein